MKIKIKNVRLAFPALFEAKAFGGAGGDAAFNATFILPPDHPQIAEISQAIKETAKEKWGAKADEVITVLKPQGKMCLRRGDDKAQYEGFEGNLYIAARSKTRPLVVDKDGTTPLVEQDGRPYAGCYVIAVLEIWAQDNKYGKRINAGLKGVQFLRDGDAFSGTGAASPDDFDDLSEGADAPASAPAAADSIV